MTIRTKRRGRSLAAILATMLMASVLAVVAGGPAQAANTSGEMLVPEDSEFYLRTYDDGVLEEREYRPDMIREFAGTHRYNTSVALAERFAQEAGSVSTVIVASGESQVDAVAAAGLAGYLEAPILLTRANRLPHNVARFIDRHNVVDVIVVGGTAAVSDAVMTTIEGLGSGPDVERVSGATRYETAAAIADFLGGAAPTWCGSSQSAAILVNGSDAGRADAVAIGPLAYALGLPILLTSADGLHEATATFLTDEAVERVVIVGGTASVPDSIIDELIEDVGVVNSRRISGGSAAGTSVAIAQEMLNPNRCGDVLETDPDRVALVNRDATADGITAGPAMGQGLGSGAVPILLVGDDLPSEVENYLASTPESRGGQKTHMQIVAIGGSAVVSPSVMSAAVAAAKTSVDFTASIHDDGNVDHDNDPATPVRGRFSVTYIDDVKLPTGTDGVVYTGDDADIDDTALDPTLYRVNGRRIDGDNVAARETDFVVNAVQILDRTVTVTLDHAFADGDVISVVGGPRVLIGANGDKRPLVSTSDTVSVAAPSRDRSGPAVEIIAVEGLATFDVILTDASALLNDPSQEGTATAPGFYIDDDGVTLELAAGGEPIELGRPAMVEDHGRVGKGTIVRLRYGVDQGVAADALADGAEIRISANTFRDANDQGNRLTREDVDEADDEFEITNISIGAVAQTLTGAATATIGDANGILITGKGDGLAAGALGNNWVIYGYRDPDSDGAPTTDVRVAVDTKHSVITYTVTTPGPIVGQPSLYHLASRLVANDDFAANFSVAYAGDANDKTVLFETGDVGIPFANGQSMVTVRVDFNDVVEALDEEGVTLAEAINHGREAPVGAVTFEAPDRMAYITYTTTTTAAGNGSLPQQGGARVIPANVAGNYHAITGCGPAGTPAPCAGGAAENTEASDDSLAAIFRQLRRGL